MSAVGHLQTCPAEDVTSASPLKADIANHDTECRLRATSRHRAGPLRQLISAGTTQPVGPGFSVTSSLDVQNSELASRADYAGRVDLHLERRAGLGRANAFYLD